MILLHNIPCSIVLGGAVYMACHGIPGWGWFLFSAPFLLFYIRTNDSTNTNRNKSD